MTIHDPDLEEAGGCHSLFRGAPSSVEFNKLRKRLMRNTRQAIEDFAMARPGERWLVALSGGKDSYGLLALLLDLKWRGLLPVDLHRLQPRPGAAEFSETHPAGFPDPAWRAAPHRIPGHLFGGRRQDPRGQHLLLALLAAQARPSLPHRARGRLLDAGARPSPRGHPRDLLHEPVPWRPAGRHAAQALERRRRCHGGTAAELLRGGRSRQVRRGHASSRSSRAISAAARKGCSATP